MLCDICVQECSEGGISEDKFYCIHCSPSRMPVRTFVLEYNKEYRLCYNCNWCTLTRDYLGTVLVDEKEQESNWLHCYNPDCFIKNMLKPVELGD